MMKAAFITKWLEIAKASPDPSCSDASNPEKGSKWYNDGFTLFKENSTFHGVKDFFQANLPLTQCVWSLILFISICFSFHGCYSIISEYLARPVVVSYFVADAGQKLALPDIIICPFNRFNRTYLEALNITDDLAQYLELAFPGPPMFPFQEPVKDRVEAAVNEHDMAIDKIISNMGNMTFSTFMRKASIHCEAFFQNKDLCKTATELMTSAGTCFRLPGGEQMSDGFGYGQRIVITLPKHLYNPGANQMLNDGIVVKLAEPGHGVDHDLTFISSGVHAIMPLSATQYEFMDDPPRYTCLDDSAKNYSRLWCFEYCLTKTAEDKCNCSLIAAANRRKEAICTTKQVIQCFYPSMFSSHEEALNAFQYCKSICKAPCKYWKYSKTVSTANLSPQQAKAFTKNETTAAELQNMIILEIFYTSLDYTVIKHMLAMTVSSFIAQLGGQVSLWIGGSVVSVFQVCVYVCGGSLAYFYRKYFQRPKAKETITKFYSSANNNEERISTKSEIKI